MVQSAVLTLAGVLTLVLNGIFSWGISRAVLIGTYLFSIGLITAARIFARSIRSRMRYWGVGVEKPDKGTAVPLLIVGAGEAANFILTQNRRSVSLHSRVVALVDDAPEKQKMRVQNIPVMGRIEDIPRLVTQLGIREIVIAMPSVKGQRLQQIIEICNATRCHVRIMSDPQDIITI